MGLLLPAKLVVREADAVAQQARVAQRVGDTARQRLRHLLVGVVEAPVRLRRAERGATTIVVVWRKA